MNPVDEAVEPSLYSIPRVSGGEPRNRSYNNVSREYSPRERG